MGVPLQDPGLLGVVEVVDAVVQAQADPASDIPGCIAVQPWK